MIFVIHPPTHMHKAQQILDYIPSSLTRNNLTKYNSLLYFLRNEKSVDYLKHTNLFFKIVQSNHSLTIMTATYILSELTLKLAKRMY